MACGCGEAKQGRRPVRRAGHEQAAEQFASPGEVTNPAGTERLKRYWTTGPGAAKIGWGKPCDFCSCLRQLRKYVPRRMLKGLCANLHHRALGMWPGQHTIDKNKAHDCPC